MERIHNLSSFLYREERGKQFLAQLHLPAVEFLAARMDSMPKPTGKDSRRFVEGYYVVELAFRNAYFRYSQMCEDVAPTCVVCNAR